MAAQATSGFTNVNGASNRARRQSSVVASTPEALGDYFTKAHEEKLRAIQEVEKKKNLEIEVGYDARRIEAVENFVLKHLPMQILPRFRP